MAGYYATYEQYIPNLISELNGSYKAVLLPEIRKAAHQFCRDTGIWKEKLVAQDIVSGQIDYDIGVNSDAIVFMLDGVKLKTTESNVFDSLSFINPNQYNFDQENLLVSFIPNRQPTYSLTGGMQISVTLVPNMVLSQGMPQWLMNRYALAIIMKTKAEMMKQKGRPWYNPELAMRYFTEYNTYISEAMWDKTTSAKNVNQQVQLMEFI